MSKRAPSARIEKPKPPVAGETPRPRRGRASQGTISTEELRTEAHTLAQLGLRVRKEVLTNHTPDSCIATAALTIRVLKALNDDVDVYALKCRVAIANKVLSDYAFERGGVFPDTGSPEYPVGGYGVGVGYIRGNETQEELDSRYNGHLVVIYRRRFMLDFSIDQASRPQHGINLVPLVIPVGEPFLRGRSSLVWRHADTWLHYMASPRAKDYVSSPAWQVQFPGSTVAE